MMEIIPTLYSVHGVGLRAMNVVPRQDSSIQLERARDLPRLCQTRQCIPHFAKPDLPNGTPYLRSGGRV